MRNKLNTKVSIKRLIVGDLSRLESRQLLTGDCVLASRDDGALQRLASQGSYWHAVYLNRAGQVEESMELLRRVITDGAPPIRARALITLGSIHVERGDFGHAATLYARVQPTCVLTALQVIRMRAVLLSLAKRHTSALDEMERASPLVRSLSNNNPIRLDWYNSLACELNAIGRPDRALPLVARMAECSILARYPEWIDTARAAVYSLNHISRPVVRVQMPVPEEKARLLIFPERGKETAEERKAFRRLHAISVAGHTDDERLLDVIIALGAANKKTVKACAQVLKRAG